jgi:GNAT superfamily N-acetyltransferase
LTLRSTEPPDRSGTAGRIDLRPATAEDRPFLLSVYAGTRTDELSVLPWSDEQKMDFLRMQFEAQDDWYRQVYPDAAFLVVIRDGVPVGRLYKAHLPTEIRLVDIALLPEHRGQGIGSRLLADLVATADRAGLPVVLRVEPWNPVRELYRRFGFATTEQGVPYETMVRRPVIRQPVS